MFFLLKKLLWIFTFNSCLFLLLVIGIQNSSNKNKTNKKIEFNKFELKKELNELVNAGLSLSAASKYLAKKNGLNKSEVYNLN